MSFTVAVIGRPNVGKSTLFNRLTGKQHAIVDDTPGVTRDRREGDGSISDLEFRLIDTAGLENAYDDSLEARMREQTEMAMAEADVTLFLIDGRAGVLPLDEHFANWLRKNPTPTLLVVNKCEGKAGRAGLYESYGLGLGEPIPFSAEHGEGLSELYDALLPYARDEQFKPILFDEDTPPEEALSDDAFADDAVEEEDLSDRPLKLAIIGRPNVGKSTMINKLLGQERLLTGPEAGVTRDAIAVAWEYQGREIRLVDTAGMRRKSRIKEKLEYMSVGDTLRSIRFAEVVVLVLDANAPLDKQDLTIARHVIEEGRALVIAVNKWDIADDRVVAAKRIEDRLQTSLPQVRGVPIVTCSSKTGKGLQKLMPAVFKAHELWNTRISTGALNRWLAATVEANPPPVSGLGRIKIRYMTQARTRPPTFILFSSRADKLPESYMRYLVNEMRADFKLPGIPIRLHGRKGDNPYAK
ncbi:MAG: ribosome biogenesis GTPase Der [Rhodospirillales bacterium]|nr:ribosome biogenesis GTPase Der [Rhodospirillales bacterium]